MSGATAELLQARHLRVAPDVDTEGSRTIPRPIPLNPN